ncbi:MAG: hypothetical protein AAF645_11710 [Myxococcota bacterium]
MRIVVPLLLLVACGGLLGGRRAEDLRAAGYDVGVAGNGWYVIEAPEGYGLSMPGIPDVRAESFALAGRAVTARFFDARAQLNTMSYQALVFDARELPAELRQGLRAEAPNGLLPTQARRVRARTRGVGPASVDEIVIDGLGVEGNHVGDMRVFERGGFVWALMVVAEGTLAPPSGSQVFFDSAAVP